MRVMEAKAVALRALLARQIPSGNTPLFRTGLEALDEAAPGGGFRCGAIHELLFESAGVSLKSFALLLAKAAQAAMGGVIAWSDPRREVNPSAVCGAGI